jgi:DNA processing protein
MPSTDPAIVHWLRLGLIAGVGDSTIRKLLGAFGLPEQVFAASRAELAAAVGEAQAERVRNAAGNRELAQGVEHALRWLAAPENHVITLADPDYPRDLLDASDPPPLLYLKGRRELLGRRAIAIVGSRNATAQGVANAESFAAALSQAGLCVVSGLALGIDAAAHRGALRHDGPAAQPAGAPDGPGSTIAVIGTGADIVYPARNRDLAHAIAERGLIVSEFPLGTPATAANFPRRNRIISGLSKGVLVIEAALRSGSLITARLAGEQGRDVFALPGSIHSPLAKGCHQLIKQGAKLVDSVDDILEELGLAAPASAASSPASDAPSRGALMDALGHDPISIDALGERTGIASHVLSAQLLDLELAGQIAWLPGGLVQRITR